MTEVAVMCFIGSALFFYASVQLHRQTKELLRQANSHHKCAIALLKAASATRRNTHQNRRAPK